MQVGIHNRKQRVSLNPTDAAAEQEIPGPSGQHSNTPFRRNRSVNGLGFSKPVSPSSSPAYPGMRKGVTSPPVREASSSSQRILDGLNLKSLDPTDGDYDHHCDIDTQGSGLQSVSKSDIKIGQSDGVGQSDDSYEESMAFKRAVRKSSRAKSTSSACSGTDTAEGGGGGGVRPPTPSKRRGSPQRRHRDSNPLSDRVPSPEDRMSGHFSTAEDGEEDDDDDYSVDEDDVDLDLDQLGMRSKEEMDVETEEEDHYDDGDSDVETSTAVSIADIPSHSSAEFQLQVDQSLQRDNTTTTHTRRECEDEGEGLRGIEGSQLAPMLRASIGGIISILPKMKGKVPSTRSSRSAADRATASAAATACASACDAIEMSGRDSVITFGPGNSQTHPWTLRKDCGINCRMLDGSRGDEIYYVGVIDILQQYNMRKRAETFIKVT